MAQASEKRILVVDDNEGNRGPRPVLYVSLDQSSLTEVFARVPAHPSPHTIPIVECAMMPLLAVDFSIGGSLRGAGDTRFPLMATMLSLIVVRCGLAALATYLGMPVVWVYAALVGDYLLKATMLIWRFQRGRWKTVVRTEDLDLKVS